MTARSLSTGILWMAAVLGTLYAVTLVIPISQAWQ